MFVSIYQGKPFSVRIFDPQPKFVDQTRRFPLVSVSGKKTSGHPDLRAGQCAGRLQLGLQLPTLVKPEQLRNRSIQLGLGWRFGGLEVWRLSGLVVWWFRVDSVALKLVVWSGGLAVPSTKARGSNPHQSKSPTT